MQTKRVIAKIVKDSRKQPTIQIIVRTSKGKFKTSAPAGKSTGKYEVKSYVGSLEKDVKYINKISADFILESFDDLKNVEKLVGGRIGGNSLFALEASLLKALAAEEGRELWELIASSLSGDNEKSIHAKDYLSIRPVGNTIGGGLHSEGKNNVKPDFQEFLFISDGETFEERMKVNNLAYKLARKKLKSWKRNDEGAWETNKTNEEVLKIMEEVRKELKDQKLKVDIGLDVAASSFYRGKMYQYLNNKRSYDKKKQIHYIKLLTDRFKIFYIEDPLEETDFAGFRGITSSLNKEKGICVGDDLTTTNPERLKKAIRMKSINAIIVKPNQIGSLLKVRDVIEIAKKAKIKIIISHRSGETKDDTIADLGVGFECDFIKTGVYGKVRKAKLNRLKFIEKTIKRKKS